MTREEALVILREKERGQFWNMISYISRHSKQEDSKARVVEAYQAIVGCEKLEAEKAVEDEMKRKFEELTK